MIKSAQEDSLTQSDKKEIQFRGSVDKFGGSKAKFDEKMMELMGEYLSKNAH